jgi:hypothetical protein
MKYSDFEKQMGDKLRSHEVDLDTTAFYKELMNGKKRKKPFAIIYRLPLAFIGILSVALLVGNFITDNKSDNSVSNNTEAYESHIKQAEVKLTPTANSIKVYDTIIKHNDIPVEQSNSLLKSSYNRVNEKANHKEDNNLTNPKEKNNSVNSIKNTKQSLSQTTSLRLPIDASKKSITSNFSSIDSDINQNELSNDITLNSKVSTTSNNLNTESIELNDDMVRSTLNFDELSVLSLNLLNTTASIPSIKDVECPDFRINKGRMAIEILAEAGYFYPIKSFIDKSGEVNEINNLRNAHESSKEGWHAGIYAKFKNTKWPIYFQAGVSQDYLTERMTLQYDYTKRDTTQGIISITTSENGDTVTAIIGDIITETEITGKKVKHYKLQTIDIPITVGYSIGFNKFTVDLEGGVLLNLSMNSKGSILTSQSDFDYVSNQNPFKSKLGLSYLGGLSIGYHISPRSKVYINTKMRIIPGEINNPTNSLSQKYNFLGLNLGYGYTF